MLNPPKAYTFPGGKPEMKAKIVGICVCMLVIATAIPAVMSVKNSTIQTTAPDTRMLIRIYTNDPDIKLPEAAEVIRVQPHASVDIILSNNYLGELSEAHFRYDILIENMDAYHTSMRGQYHSLAEIEIILENIANMYPDITSLYSIGTTYEGRNIRCLEITDNPGIDEGEPGLLFYGLTHAREWPTVEICLHLIDELTSGYGSDPDITTMVNNRRIWIITCLNPDGYYYCHDQGFDWRKNRHYFPEFGTYGVDIDRNYGGSCDGNPWGSWGNILSDMLSHRPGYEGYCGPSPFSENETQAIRDLFLNNDICAIINWHTYGEYIVFPWAYTWHDIPDFHYIYQIGRNMGSLITKQSGSSTYPAYQWADHATGPCVDYTYGYSHFTLGRAVFPYVIEACSEFHPSAEYLDQVCAENFDGAWYLLQEAENISALIPRVLPPKIDDLTIDSDGDYTVSWEEQNPSANPKRFQLDELSNHFIVIDDAESGLDLWTYEGFNTSDIRFHSATHSFKSRYSESDVSALTTTDPLLVTEGMKLSFWAWYDIDTSTDRGFVEISRDGRNYEIIDIYKGKSTDWTYKEYNLEDYINESIFIRFRYTTDAGYQGEGFYVDDITPVSDYQTITNLSDSITEHSFEVTGRSNGNYSYRVRGFNEEYGWGDFSRLENIAVQGVEAVNFTLGIKGGLGVTADITNTGTMNATNIQWKFTLTGGIILLGKTKSGTITSLAAGASATAKDSLILGFGKTTIKLEVTCAEGASATQTATGIVLLFFVLGVKER